MTEVATEAGLAKVIYVIDDAPVPSRPVIHRWSRHGVQVGDKFLVFGYGPDLTDPDTGENLGRLEVVRGRGQVVHVQDDLATIRSMERRQVAGTRKRVVHKSGLLVLAGERIEEDLPSDEIAAFEGVHLGDLAKPI